MCDQTCSAAPVRAYSEGAKGDECLGSLCMGKETMPCNARRQKKKRKNGLGVGIGAFEQQPGSAAGGPSLGQTRKGPRGAIRFNGLGL